MSERESMSIEADEIETIDGRVEIETGIVTLTFTSRLDSAPDLGAFRVVEDLEVVYEGVVLEITADQYETLTDYVFHEINEAPGS